MSSDKIWNGFPGCVCLKSILIECGFDNIPSLMTINDGEIRNLEEYIGNNRSITEKLTCDHSKSYGASSGTSNKFQFLPGHRAILLDWCQNTLHAPSSVHNNTFTMEDPAFSPLLRAMIGSARSLHGTPPNTHRFPPLLIDFSIYTYIMAGRACYDVLCANLPLPKTGTIGIVFFLQKIGCCFCTLLVSRTVSYLAERLVL